MKKMLFTILVSLMAIASAMAFDAFNPFPIEQYRGDTLFWISPNGVDSGWICMSNDTMFLGGDNPMSCNVSFTVDSIYASYFSIASVVMTGDLRMTNASRIWWTPAGAGPYDSVFIYHAGGERGDIGSRHGGTNYIASSWGYDNWKFSVPVYVVGGDRINVIDASAADTSYWYDDGDTTRIESDNPIKVGGDVFVGDSLFVGGVNVGGDIADLWDSLGTISPELDLYLEYSAAPDTLTASTIASGNAGSVVFLPRNTVASTAHYNVVGGTDNSSTMPWTTIGGGTGHTATAWYATIGGGYQNSALDSGATVAGGYTNTASSKQSFVGGGVSNTASGWGSSIAGGLSNAANGVGSGIGGGINNNASGNYSAIPGGNTNTASGYVSFAFGQYVVAADSFSAHFFTAEDSLDEAYEGELVVGGAIRVEHDTLTTAVWVDSSGLSADVDTSFKQGFDWFDANPEYYVQGGSSGSNTIRPSAYSVGDYIMIYRYDGMVVDDSLVIFVDLDGSDSIFAVAYDTTVTLTDTIFTAYDGVSVFRTIYTSYLTADSITAANWIAAVRIDADSMAADYFIGGISEMDTVVADKIVTDTLVMGSDELTDLGKALEFFDSTGTYTALSAWLAGDYLGLTASANDVDTSGTDIAAALADRQPLATVLTQLASCVDSVTCATDSVFLWKAGKRSDLIFATP